MDLTDIDPEIAAAMGFAAFGAQPSTKRRKFTHDDAIIDGQDDETIAAKSGSGANNTALGVRTRPTRQDGVVETEIETEKEKEGSPHGGDKKTKTKAKKGAPRGLADYLAWGNSVAAPEPAHAPATAQTVTTEETVEEEDHSVVAAVSAQEENVGATAGAEPRIGGLDAASWPQGLPSHEEMGALRRGVKNTRGDMVYFRPSFIEDPWKELVG